MARTVPRGLASVLEELELERPQIVTMRDLEGLCSRVGVRTEPRVVASRLRERGWLLPTARRGVWEFAPAELAGAYSSCDPLLPARAIMAARPEAGFALAGHSAAWALGFADRAPATVELAFPGRVPLRLPDGVRASSFAPARGTAVARGVPSLRPEGIVVHLGAKPDSSRSWHGVREWLPEVARELDPAALLEELEGRSAATAARTGYLVQGLRPDAASAVMEARPPSSAVRFGPRRPALRHDALWLVSDSLLPFDPRDMEAVE